MAKFKKEEFIITTSNTGVVSLKPGDRKVLRFTVDVQINASGTFYIVVPPDIVEQCEAQNITLHTFYVNSSKTIPNTIASETYEKLKEKIVTTLKPLVNFTVKSNEVVIRYSFGGYAHYTVGSDETLQFDGNRKGEQGDGWSWAGSDVSPFRYEPFSVGIGVEVYEKQTIIYNDNKEKIIYSRLTYADEKKQPELHELLRVRKVAVGSKYNEVEYTEQVARAMNTGIMGIINLYDSLQKFNHVEAFLDYANTLDNQKLISNE